MKIITARAVTLPALLLPLIFSPLSWANDEQTLITATPQTVSELDTPAAVSVVDGDDASRGPARQSFRITGRSTGQIQKPIKLCSGSAAVDPRISALHLRRARYSNVC